MQQLDYLINYLLEENPQLKVNKPSDITGKFNLYRSLCNIRKPKEVSREYMEVENKFLSNLLETKDITYCGEIKSIKECYPSTALDYGDILCLWKGDITSLSVDAIVNAANSQGLGCFVPLHNCIDNQIHTYAGVQLRLECDKLMNALNYNLPCGEVILTNAFNLPSKHVIHTPGPIITNEVTSIKKQELANCYENSLKVASDNNIETIAFPCISTGVFRFPNRLASLIAIETVSNYLDSHGNSFKKIIFNTYSQKDFDIYERNITKG